jgi:hypothetical protein
MTWRTEGADVRRLQARVATLEEQLQRARAAGVEQEGRCRELEAEVATLRCQLEEARAGRKLL